MSSTPTASSASEKQPRAAAQSGSDAQAGAQEATRKTGFGLPCAHCRTYYPADLKECPVCKSSERVSATAFPAPPVAPANEVPDPIVLEEEREKFLREFKAKVFASQMPIGSPVTARCVRTENHQNGSEPPVVCQACYEQLQERVDVLEAALHMDLKEAAQIVYDAVWSDPSDSSKTYQNAAHALLTELRKRSGVTPTFGLLQPMLD